MIKHCGYCGVEFSTTKKKQVYCSVACARAAFSLKPLQTVQGSNNYFGVKHDCIMYDSQNECCTALIDTFCKSEKCKFYRQDQKAAAEVGASVPKSAFNDCRNELCYKCGKYKLAHLGACNGCRWEASKWAD